MSLGIHYYDGILTAPGPNATTFIVPSECFPTRLRATAHGVSAAAGKIGAIVAQVAFAPLVNRGATPTNPHPWLDKVMQIFALFMLCGTIISFLIPETKRKTLEELAGENEFNPVYDAGSIRSASRTTADDLPSPPTPSYSLGRFP